MASVRAGAGGGWRWSSPLPTSSCVATRCPAGCCSAPPRWLRPPAARPAAGVTPDVVWAPTIAPLALSPRVPLVLTVQDLSFELRPGDFTAYERVWHRLARPRALARRRGAGDRAGGADAGSAGGALGAGRRPRSRWWRPGSRVTRGAAPARWAAFPPPGTPPPGTYLLAVGALEPRKAPDLLVRAFAAARASGPGRRARVRRRRPPARTAAAATGVRLLGRVSDARARRALPRRASRWSCPRCWRATGCRCARRWPAGRPAVISRPAGVRPRARRRRCSACRPATRRRCTAALLRDRARGRAARAARRRGPGRGGRAELGRGGPPHAGGAGRGGGDGGRAGAVISRRHPQLERPALAARAAWRRWPRRSSRPTR